MQVRIAAIGDSDSQSYHDSLWVGRGGEARGGDFHDVTFQWGEVLSKLRGTQVDMGPWRIWGSRRSMVRVLDWFGIQSRAPRKEDFRYNFAFAGAQSRDLMKGNLRQVPRLVALMDQESEAWRHGVVVIRIGITSLGTASSLDRFARDPLAPQAQAPVAESLAHIQDSVNLIRKTHPTTRIVLVGILNNVDFPPWSDKWQSPTELTRIASGLDVFDRGLQQIAAGDPGIAFFDDRAWFAQRWGSRGTDGWPNYLTLKVGDYLTVSHSAGDSPVNSVLSDGHAGLVWNTLWAQSLVSFLNHRFGSQITPISNSEISHFLVPLTTFKYKN